MFSNLFYLPDISKWNNNISMSSLFEKDSSIIKLVYEIKKEKEIIKLFDEFFIRHNKIKCKIIINNNLYTLRDKYKIQNNHSKKIKIKLMILNNKGLNLKKMFYNCKNLKEFSFILKEKYDKESKEKNNNTPLIFNKPNHAKIINKQLIKKEKKLYSVINNFPKKKLNLIYYYSKDNKYSNEQIKQMKKIIILSNSFLSLLSPFYSFQLKQSINNNINSINKNLLYLMISIYSNIRKENNNKNNIFL